MDSCLFAALEVPGALRGALGVLQRCLRGTLEVPGALKDASEVASEVPERCLRSALEVPSQTSSSRWDSCTGGNE